MMTIERLKLAILLPLATATPAALAHPYGQHDTGYVLLQAHSHAGNPGSWMLALGFLAAGVGLQLASHKLRALHDYRWPARLAAWCLAASGAALLMA